MSTPRSIPLTITHVLALAMAWLSRQLTPRQSLHDLDDHALRDIGVQRSEIASIEAESRGHWAQATRLRIVALRSI